MLHKEPIIKLTFNYTDDLDLKISKILEKKIYKELNLYSSLISVAYKKNTNISNNKGLFIKITPLVGLNSDLGVLYASIFKLYIKLYSCCKDNPIKEKVFLDSMLIGRY